MIMHHNQYRIGPYTTSEKEITDLSIAWLAISFAFAIVMYDKSIGFLQIWAISAITVGTGFLLHELGHKITAQRYGCFAEFRASFSMLAFAVLMSFSGIIFAAPGAVMISGYVNNITNGKISASGPLVNLMLALLFLLLGLLPINLQFLQLVFAYGFSINTWLALFNMIPFGVLDGVKILRWDKRVYGAMVAVSLFFLIL
jgi:Zn-dependent protease